MTKQTIRTNRLSTKTLTRVLGILVPGLFLGAGQSASQTLSLPVSLTETERHTVASAVTGREYEVFVSLPDGYRLEEDQTYPVLYVLDGNLGFPLVSTIYDVLREGDDVAELIIVGIGYRDGSAFDVSDLRFAEYSPSRFPLAERTVDQPAELPTGQGPAFLDAMREEIFPFIEQRYRVMEDRGVVGHSIAGLLALHVMFTEPGLFRRYLISSPSLWWNQAEVFETEANFARSGRALGVRAYLSVGGEENDNQVPPFNRLVDVLEIRSYGEFEWHHQVVAGKSHMSVVPHAFSAGLEFLYPSG